MNEEQYRNYYVFLKKWNRKAEANKRQKRLIYEKIQ